MNRPFLVRSLFLSRGFLSLVVALNCCRHTLAQEAVFSDLPATSNSLSPREIDILRGLAASAPAVDQPAAVTGEQLAEIPRRFTYGLTATVRGVYDDNITLSSFNPVSDYYVSIEPMLSFGFGGKGEDVQGSSTLLFTYRPQLFLFIDHSDHDTLQHLIRLQASHVFGRLVLSVSQDVQILDGQDLNSLSDPTGHNANIDVNQRTRHNVFTTQVNDTYDLTGKLFLSNSISFSVDNYPSQFIGSKNISANLFLNYNYGGKLTVGLGGTGGYNIVEQGSPDQIYEQANIRINYAATGKLSFAASGGAEFRQFENAPIGTARGTVVSPVYDLSASYRPFDGTSISLVGSRRTQNSASLTGQDYTETDIHLTIAQRFLRRFTLGLAVGYINNDYFGVIEGLTASRNDDYYYVQPTVDATITRWWSAGAYYLYRKDASSLAFFGFENNQVGLRSTITF